MTKKETQETGGIMGRICGMIADEVSSRTMTLANELDRVHAALAIEQAEAKRHRTNYKNLEKKYDNVCREEAELKSANAELESIVAMAAEIIYKESNGDGGHDLYSQNRAFLVRLEEWGFLPKSEE